jgi:hypothetical protein
VEGSSSPKILGNFFELLAKFELLLLRPIRLEDRAAEGGMFSLRTSFSEDTEDDIV